MTDEEAIKIDEWEIKGKKAEVWIVKGKLQIRALGVIHNVELKALEENRKLKEALNKIRAEIEKESEVKTLQLHWGEAMGLNKAIEIIDKYISEVRGDTDGKE